MRHPIPKNPSLRARSTGHGRRGFTLVLVVAAGLALAAGLAFGCADPHPKASVSILDCRKLTGPPVAARLTYRIVVAKGPGLKRYGLTFHLTNLLNPTTPKEYWVTDLVIEDLPGASAITSYKDIELSSSTETLSKNEVLDFWYD